MTTGSGTAPGSDRRGRLRGPVRGPDAGARAGPGDPHRPGRASPVPADAVPVRDRHLVRGQDRRPAARATRQAPQRRIRHSRGDRHRCRPAAGAGPAAAGRAGRVRLRLPHPGRRRAAVLLRARRVRPDRARDEDHRGRPEDPATGLRRVRDGRVRRRPGRTGPLAHLRPGRRRTDRRGTGRADPRGRDQDAAPRVPAHQARRRPGPAVRRRQPPRWRCSARNCPPWPPGTWASSASSCTWARSSPTSTPDGLQVKDHDGTGDPVRRRQRAVDRGRGGAAAGYRGGQGHRRGAGPGRADRGRQGPAPSPAIRRSWSPGT